MKRQILSIFIPALLAACLCTFVLIEYQRIIHSPINITETTSYTVEPGMNIKRISQTMSDNAWIDFPPLYVELYARIHQQAQHIKAGEYQIEPGMTVSTLLERFVDGKVTMNRFTIIEGTTAKEFIEQVKLTSTIHTDFDEAQLLNTFSIEQSSIEGWFLPETYHYPTGTSALDFMLRAYEQMKVVLDTEWANRADDLPYETPYEALIMASIIEKETGIAEERPEIAGVFVRRLKKGMRLQTDPTVIYGMGEKYDGNIRRKDLRTDTPYNTYTRFGLPPTPICLPSQAAIHAALHPANGDSLFFVATGQDGRHVFSSSLEAHNAAVRKYQLKK
jgi:UPF0755 protein